MPIAVFTFLERYDFSGKVIRPFCIHEGSDFRSSLFDSKNECPGAEVGGDLSIQGRSVNDARGEVEKWMRGRLV